VDIYEPRDGLLRKYRVRVGWGAFVFRLGEINAVRRCTLRTRAVPFRLKNASRGNQCTRTFQRDRRIR